MKKKSNDYKKFLESINFGYSIINNNNFAELDKDGFTIIKSDKDYWEKIT